MVVTDHGYIGSVHLVYCESGIETLNGAKFSTEYGVHLVYCESGIETKHH